MRAIIRITQHADAPVVENWGDGGWQSYKPAPLDWPSIGFDGWFDDRKEVGDDLILYINKGTFKEDLVVGLFAVNATAQTTIAHITPVLTKMLGEQRHVICVPLDQGGYLEDLTVPVLRVYQEEGCLPDELFAQMDAHNASLNLVLTELVGFESANRIRIFGSASKGKQVPGDIDLYVDLNGMESDEERALTGALLRLANKRYGLLDPFLDKNGVLYTRNDDANGWMKARKAAKIRSDGVVGLPLCEVGIVTRPYETMRPKTFSIEFRCGC